MKIIGPFKQILSLDGLAIKGALSDENLEAINNGGIAVADGLILDIGNFEGLIKKYPKFVVEKIDKDLVLLPGFIDCHTHSCFAGSRAMDFAERNSGTSYLEIAKNGGGIWSTVMATRAMDSNILKTLTENRIDAFLKNGVTTIEIKSGYGLNLEHEIRLLEIINSLNTKAHIVPTCLAAHVKPKDFEGSSAQYLDFLMNELLPKIKLLTNRVDIFTEESAFDIEESKKYLSSAQKMGFDVTVHADQFNSGSGKMAAELGAASADHLEATSDSDILFLAKSNTVVVALPGASLGLGEPFSPARKLLDAGSCLAIASDFNPGSAPMGDLLLQAAILASYEKLTTAEVFSALTFRAAKALNLSDRGRLKQNLKADFQAYPCNDYREILYQQGQLRPSKVWVDGLLI